MEMEDTIFLLETDGSDKIARKRKLHAEYKISAGRIIIYSLKNR
jgi:hypothetical protein